nr:CHRD domain-containing protein [Tsuneonella flava]
MTRLPLIATAAVGALALAGCATVEEAVASATNMTYHANLTGAQEVGGGDADGTGKASITISDNFDQVCWDLHDIHNIDTVTAAHIHYGVAGTNGPPVFTLTKSNEGTWKGAVRKAPNGRRTAFRAIRSSSMSISTPRHIPTGRSAVS